MKKMDDFELNLEDAAITLGQDGKINLYMPKYDDDDQLDPNKHQHVFTAIAIMMLFDDPRFTELINEKVNIIISGVNNTGSCGDGCGGCSGSCEVPPDDV